MPLLSRANWQRPDQPALSAMTTTRDWCRVQLYSPSVIRLNGRYWMWYIGNATRTRSNDTTLGLAESADGITWTPHPDNPILIRDDLPAGLAWQTPHVLYDPDEQRFKLWFVMTDSQRDPQMGLVSFRQMLGYATSADGIAWDVHPEPLYPSGRRPCVIKDGPAAYRMWMNSDPNEGRGAFSDLVGSIYRFTSPDGIRWTRDPEPVVQADDTLRSVVYPFVLHDETGYTMWYGCHVDSGVFEIYCSTSENGLNWTHHRDAPAYPATRDPSDFDGRYTSTPCVLDDGDRYLLYYSTRDWGNLYGAGDGTVRVDKSGIYRHIGVAVCPKE